jgi:hypothetical protein
MRVGLFVRLTGLFVRLAGLFTLLAGFEVFENKICQTVGDEIFFLPILFWELTNNKIWKTKFTKLLEMLLPT